MALRTPDTKDEQNQAHNPSQKYYDREFNSIVNLGKEQGETARELKEQEAQAGKQAGIDQLEAFANDPKNATKNIDKTKEREESGNWQTNLSPNQPGKNKAKLSGWKRKGPLGMILAILALMGGIGFSGLTLMPITIAEHFTNDLHDANNSSQRKIVNLFGKKTNGSDFKRKLSICNSVVTFRCKMKTIPPNLVERFEKEGFKFHDKTTMPGNRIGFSAIEFPDGAIAHTSAELAAMLKEPAKALLFSAVYSLKNSLMLIGSWFKDVLRGLNLTKGKKIEGKTKAEADKSFEQAAKGEKGTVSTSSVGKDPGQNATEEQKKAAQAVNESGNETARTINEAIAKGSKLKRLSLRIANALAIPQLACLTYNLAGFIATTAKIKKALAFAGFAMIFLTLASSIKANKATEAEVAKGMDVLSPSTYPEKVEDPATGQMIDNPNIGKNALDAEAYKVVAYGDQINLTGIATKFFVASGFLGVVQKVVTWINEHIGKSVMKTTCQVVNSTVAQIISFLAAPVISAVIMGVVAVLPVEEWAAGLVNLAIDAAAGPDLVSAVKGVDAGNVLFIGTAVIMGTTAIKFGLKPGKLDAIRKNMAENHKLIEQEVAMKTLEARKTPLDITNRYSFLGSMAFQLASLMPNTEKFFVSSISKMLAAAPKSFTMLTKNANAAYSMPVANYSETRFNQCTKDDAYNAMRQYFTPDMFCVLRAVPDNEIDADVVFDSLEASGDIDKINANPQPGSYAEKYMRYCVNRTDPWGSTSVAAEDQNEDPKWYTGEMCFGGRKNNLMSEYVGYKVTQDTIDSYPKTRPVQEEEQAFWNSSNDDTYIAITSGMSFMLEGAR